MKGKMKRSLCVITAAAVLLGGIQIPALAEMQESGKQTETVGLSGEEGITVTTAQEFMSALSQKKSPITIGGNITFGNQAEESGRMKPVIIPANTLIRGTENVELCSRCPIQMEGDGVVFQDLKLVFESSDALGSVPHREIFLGGYNLTLDNVNTYLEGAGSEPGGLLGSEKELLPTVYAGGYTGTAVGDHASLTVRNANMKNSDSGTMFKAIYMGHEGGSDNNTAYKGSAVLNLDADTVVREGIHTDCNSRAEINITGKDGTYQDLAKAKEFYGNENTTLTLSRATMENAVADTVGNIVLSDEARLSPETGSLNNVTLQNGACLDFNALRDAAEITGDFTGVSNEGEKRGILVLNPEGTLIIHGAVTGTTQFQTSNRMFPGTLLPDKTYIIADAANATESGFVLDQSYIDRGYKLKYDVSGWTVEGAVTELQKVGRIELCSAPKSIDLRKIAEKADGSIPDENAYFEIIWYDENGNPYSDSDVIDTLWFYEADYVVRIRTDYWENDSEEVMEKTDWFQDVYLMASEENPGRYYLQAYELAEPGDFTFLFLAEPFEGDLVTVADVKALKNVVKAESRVIFYNEDTGIPEDPDHRHTYEARVTKEPTCTEEGIKTYACSCGEEYTEQIAALGHKEVTDPAVEPTETEDGKTEGSHCSVCGEVLKEQQIIPATGKPDEHEHKYEVTVTKEPTCTEEGIKTYACSCGEEYTEQIAALGHKEVTDPAVEPTETEDGKTEGSHCSVCKEVLKEQQIIPATGKPEHEHKYEATVTKEPTCTEEGIKTYTCSCGEEYTEKIAALGHKEVTDPAVEPTETEDGKTEGSHCSVCKEVLKEQQIIPATGKPGEHEHKYEVTVTKEPTCTEEGIKTYTCSCGEKYIEKIAALGHKYVEKRIPATTISNGKVQRVCSVCAESSDIAVIERPGKIKWSKTDFTYDGKAKTPSVVIEDITGKKLTAGTDYRLVYSKGRKNPGVYTATLEFCGNYSGKVVKTFTIRPQKTSLKKITARSRGLRVTWKKQTTQTDGYQIQYSTNRSFKGKAAKIAEAGKKGTAKNISRLKGKKKYYVRIRTYKTVKVNGKKRTLYSDWSKSKTIRTKK